MAGPVLSHRQRFDESNARSVTNLMSALQAIKAAKDEKEAQRRAGVQDQLTALQVQQGQQSVEQNQMTLDRSKQDTGMVSAFNDQIDREMNPAAAGPAMPGQPSPFDVSPFTEKGLKSKGDDFKYSIIAKRRTLGGKESTPDMVRQEYEAASAQNADTLAAAAKAPELRALDLRTKTAAAAGTEANTAKTVKETELLGKPKPPEPGDAMELAKFARTLKQDFMGNQLTKDFQIIERTNASMTKSLADWKTRAATATAEGKTLPRGALDQTMITLFNKLLDPSSVVRESEYARTPEGMAFLDRVAGKLQTLQSGGAGVTSAFLDEMQAAASTLMAAAEDGFARHTQDAIGDAQTYGIEPERVVGGYSRYLNHGQKPTRPAPIPGIPQVGAGPLKVGRFQVEAAD